MRYSITVGLDARGKKKIEQRTREGWMPNAATTAHLSSDSSRCPERDFVNLNATTI